MQLQLVSCQISEVVTPTKVFQWGDAVDKQRLVEEQLCGEYFRGLNDVSQGKYHIDSGLAKVGADDMRTGRCGSCDGGVGIIVDVAVIALG